MPKNSTKKGKALAVGSLSSMTLDLLSTLKPKDSTAKLAALTGEQGRTDIANMIDVGALRYVQQLIKDKLKAEMGGARTLMRIELFDDAGLAPIDAPVIKPKALIDKLVKSLPSVDLIALPRWWILRGYPDSDAPPLVVTAGRGLGLVDEGQLDAVLSHAQRLNIARNGVGLPAISISKVKPGKLEKAVDWVTAIDTVAHNLLAADGPKLTPAQLKNWETLRLAEIHSLVEIGAVLVGAGSFKSIAQAVRTKVAAFQKSRSDDGLQQPFDPWVEWCRVRAASGKPDHLPVRLELPTKARFTRPLKRAGNAPPKKPVSDFGRRQREKAKKRRRPVQDD